MMNLQDCREHVAALTAWCLDQPDVTGFSIAIQPDPVALRRLVVRLEVGERILGQMVLLRGQFEIDEAAWAFRRVREGLGDALAKLRTEVRPGSDLMIKAVLREAARFIGVRNLDAWLDTPNELLGNETPRALIDRGQGRRILDAMDRLRAGHEAGG